MQTLKVEHVVRTKQVDSLGLTLIDGAIQQVHSTDLSVKVGIGGRNVGVSEINAASTDVDLRRGGEDGVGTSILERAIAIEHDRQGVRLSHAIVLLSDEQVVPPILGDRKIRGRDRHLLAVLVILDHQTRVLNEHQKGCSVRNHREQMGNSKLAIHDPIRKEGGDIEPQGNGESDIGESKNSVHALISNRADHFDSRARRRQQEAVVRTA